MKNKRFLCDLCEHSIHKKKDAFLKCPFCEVVIHQTCAEASNRIAKNNLFYCSNHTRHIPQYPKRTEKVDLQCYSCKQYIRISSDHHECEICHKKFHYGCVASESNEEQREEGNWKCHNCLYKDAETSKSKNAYDKNRTQIEKKNDEIKLDDEEVLQKVLDKYVESRLEAEDLRGRLSNIEARYNFLLQGNPSLSSVFNFATNKESTNRMEEIERNYTTPPNNHNNDNNQANTSRQQHTYGNNTLESMLEDSIRRVTKENDKSDLHKIAELQLIESQKNTYRNLPIVKNKDYSWKLFYTAYRETKEMFRPIENVARITKSIQCEEIRRMGGNNLFNVETCDKTLLEIDKRIGQPRKLLLNERSKLTEINYLNDSNPHSIIEFIEKVKQYSELVDIMGSNGHKCDEDLIAHLSRILPPRLKLAWTDRYNDLEDIKGEVLIKDLARFLDGKIKRYETCSMFEKLDPYRFNEYSNKKLQPDRFKRQNMSYSNKVFAHVEKRIGEEVSKPKNSLKGNAVSFNMSAKNKSPTNYCFYHEKTGHSSLICYTLRKLTGREVCEIAKNKGICTCCGDEHEGQCPRKSQLICPIPECTFKHESIFCFHRKTLPQNEKFKKKYENVTNVHSKSRNPNSKDLTLKHKTDAANNNVQIQCNALMGESSEPPETAGYWTIREIEEGTSHAILNKTEKTIQTSPTLLSVIVIELGNSALKGAFLLDSGSTTSLIEEKWADSLKLEGPVKPISLSWSGGRIRHDNESRIVRTVARGIHRGGKTHEIYFRTMKDLNMPNQYFNAAYMKSRYSHLNCLELESYTQIIGIIGNDQSKFFEQIKWITLNEEQTSPIAILTPLGYSVIGSVRPLSKIYDSLKKKETDSEVNEKNFVFNLSLEEEKELNKLQEGIMGYEYKRPFENDRKIAEDEYALKLLRDKVKKVPNSNRYEAPLLWREETFSLPTKESLKVAIKRNNITIKYAIKLGIFEEIKAQINNLIAKGYARELTQNEIKNPPKNTFYIPIFITQQKNKRPRLIWDAACKVEGKSLNDFLLAGPNLYVDLLKMLFQMREGKYLVKADISEMFHQVQITEEDRAALRFVFSDTPCGSLKFYEMVVLIFGSICSPTTSQFIKNIIADNYERECPKAAHAIKNNTYVDDLVVSFDDLEEGKKLIYDAKKMLATGGFELVKLKGNDPQILELIKLDKTMDTSNPKTFSEEKSEKLLGYIINFETNTISLGWSGCKVSHDTLDGLKLPTKKEVLRFMMSIFDPLGLFSYYTSKMKLIFHWLCKEKIEWEEKIKEKQLPYWTKCLLWLKEIIKIEIPRNYFPKSDKNYKRQLIVFGDAGTECLCCVAYIRIVDKKRKQMGYSLIGSKTFIVPIKQKRSVPELELDIAVKCTEYAQRIEKSHTVEFEERIFFTDSSCVWHWIKKPMQKPTIYVKNRILKTKSNSEISEWRWIKGELQPADFGTKFSAMPITKYDENTFYHPKVFSMPEEDWPVFNPEKDACLLHVESVVKTIEDPSELMKYGNFSSFKRLIRVAQLALRFKGKTEMKIMRKKISIASKSEKNKLNEKLKKLELEIGRDDYKYRQIELALIRDVQRSSFKEELDHLNKNELLPEKHKLRKFLPKIGEDGLLRITTRLGKENNFPLDKISPIILPPDHHLTHLLILSYHENNFHSNFDTVIANLLQRFFISNIRWRVKKLIRNRCMKCKRLHAKPDEPLMGNLPSYRLAQFTPAFSYIIVDVCGPIKVRVNRTSMKRWLMVFSCLTTRAINIEILHSLDSNSCLMALQNHINIRGAPHRIISDRGSNFIGANNALLTTFGEWNKKLLEKGTIADPIIWEFNPAKASSMSGSVERMIKIIKNVLEKMSDSLNKKLIIPSDETFRCMVCEIVGMINNRPLSNIPLIENSFLTPNQFIMFRSNFQTSPNNVDYNKGFVRNWREVKEFINSLWHHWNVFYLTEIMNRQKWHKLSPNVEVGEIVIVADPSICSLWRLGKVTKVYPGSNDQVRKVQVQLGKRDLIDKKIVTRSALRRAYQDEKLTLIERPVTQIARIELKAS